jgi:hypothetical protein
MRAPFSDSVIRLKLVKKWLELLKKDLSVEGKAIIRKQIQGTDA